jgi:hypothetical protein
MLIDRLWRKCGSGFARRRLVTDAYPGTCDFSLPCSFALSDPDSSCAERYRD